jgi:hypothetical protein
MPYRTPAASQAKRLSAEEAKGKFRNLPTKALTRLGSVSSPTVAKSRHNRPGYLVDTNIAAEKITIMTKTKYQVCVRTSSCAGPGIRPVLMNVKYTKANPAPNMFKRMEATIILRRKVLTQVCFKEASV